MFEKDIVCWALVDWSVEVTGELPDKVQEVHLLKDGGILFGPRIPKDEWERNQRRMAKPYPEHLRKSIQMLHVEAMKQGRLL